MHKKYLDKLQSKINKLHLAYYEPSYYKKAIQGANHSFDSLLNKAGILTVSERYKYHLLEFTFKALKFSSSVNEIKSFFVFSQTSRRQLLQTVRHDSIVFQKSIVYQGCKCWNALPLELRDINLTLSAFQSQLISFLRKSRVDDYVY